MKKFIAMLLALAMVLSLAACGSPLRQRHRPLQKSLPRLKRPKNLLPLLSL